MKNITRTVTGLVRLNYINIERPRKSSLDLHPKFSVTIIIPKESETMAKIYSAMTNATKNGIELWGGQVPSDLITPLKDGDIKGKKDYEACFYINATSKYKPQLVDKNLKELNPDELKNGDYARVSLNFYPYNHKESGNCGICESGNCGICCELLNIQKIGDGERIVNRASAVDDFDVVDDRILI